MYAVDPDAVLQAFLASGMVSPGMVSPGMVHPGIVHPGMVAHGMVPPIPPRSPESNLSLFPRPPLHFILPPRYDPRAEDFILYSAPPRFSGRPVAPPTFLPRRSMPPRSLPQRYPEPRYMARREAPGGGRTTPYIEEVEDEEEEGEEEICNKTTHSPPTNQVLLEKLDQMSHAFQQQSTQLQHLESLVRKLESEKNNGGVAVPENPPASTPFPAQTEPPQPQ